MTELCFVSCDKTYLVGKLLVVCGTLTDIMGEVYCISAIIDAVNIVLTVDIWNTCLGLDSRFLETVNSFAPCIRIDTSDS